MSTRDLNESVVKSIHPETGYPMDEYGHLLNPYDRSDGHIIPDWDKPGTKLYSLTSPYGFLTFAVGSRDDFTCFDYTIINDVHKSTPELFLILHAVINSETGSFIQDAGYMIIREKDYDNQALGFVEQALDWLSDNEVKHTKNGWAQDPWCFARAVHVDWLTAKGEKLLPYSEREKRLGSKRLNHLCNIPVIDKPKPKPKPQITEIYKVRAWVNQKHNRGKAKGSISHPYKFEEIIVNNLETAKRIYEEQVSKLKTMYQPYRYDSGYCQLFIPHIFDDGTLAYWPDHETYISTYSF